MTPLLVACLDHAADKELIDLLIAHGANEGKSKGQASREFPVCVITWNF
jgi:hypothetical protein